MEETPIKRDEKGRWVKGNPPGPGRPVGSTLKEYVRKYLSLMTDAEKDEWLDSLPKDMIWKMAEGNPSSETDITTNGESLQPLLVKFLNGNEPDNNGNPK